MIVVSLIKSKEVAYISRLAINDPKYPTRWLYLFSDSLSLSAHEFSLSTTWIEPMSDEFKKGHAFRIVSPERRIVVCSNDKQEKERFLELVNYQVRSIY